MERILALRELQPEAPLVMPDDPPAAEWPRDGSIRFESVRMRYRAGTPLVLKGLSFAMRPGERVGVCGRTGAGKSSLLAALFRLVEIEGGSHLFALSVTTCSDVSSCRCYLHRQCGHQHFGGFHSQEKSLDYSTRSCSLLRNSEIKLRSSRTDLIRAPVGHDRHGTEQCLRVPHNIVADPLST